MQVQIFPTRATGISISKPVTATVTKVYLHSIRVQREHSSRDESFELLKITGDGRKVYSGGRRERIIL